MAYDHVFTALPNGPQGERIKVMLVDFNDRPSDWPHYHAVTMGINDATLEGCIDRTQAAFDRDHVDDYPWPDPVYQAGLMYACGYRD